MTNRFSLLRIPLLAGPLLVLGCGGQELASPAYEIFDSAGVEVVVSHAASGFETPWTVSSEPILRIGAGRNEEEYLFQSIMGTARLSDGAIVVMEWPTGEIRRFDAKGRYLVSFAGRGEGPGEFQSPRGLLQRLGDTLVVLDSDGTVARFDPEGRLLNEIPAHGLIVRDEASSGEWTNVSPDGVLWGARYPRDREIPVRTLFRTPYLIISSDTSREEIKTLGQYRLGGDFRDPGGQQGTGYYPVFRTAVRASRNPTGLIVGDNETFAIEVFDRTGTLQRRIKYPGGIREADPAMVEEERQAWVEQFEIGVERGRPWNIPAWRRYIKGLPDPPTWPGFWSLIGDEEGYIWTFEYGPKDAVPTAMRSEDEPYEALVFHPRGHLLGSVRIPARFTPMEIGPDYLLGVETDDLGVKEAVLYGLEGRGG